MSDLEKLSRDQLRSNVNKLKIMPTNEVKKLGKQGLIALLKSLGNGEKLGKHIGQQHEIDNKIEELKLGEIFPFEREVFSNYKQFKHSTVLKTVYENKFNIQNLDNYLSKIENTVINDIKENNLKINFNLEVELIKPGTNETFTFYFQSKIKELLRDDDRVVFYQNTCLEIKGLIENQELRESAGHF